MSGSKFKLNHLDGKTYMIATRPNDIVADKQKRILKGLGMPGFKKENTFGNLIIEFIIDMPEKGTIKIEDIE